MTADHSPTPFNSAKADDFANGLLTMLNQSSLCLMISIGHRTGLFDTMSNLEPSSSAEIASKASLNERYVREWLGAMVTGGVVRVRSEYEQVFPAAGTCGSAYTGSGF